MSRFDKVFERVVGHEGGFTRDPNDSGNWTGGAKGVGQLRGTKYGISAASYPKIDIERLTLAEAKEIYRRDFWDSIRGDELPPPIDEFTFDFAVNSGVQRATLALQTALGVLRDGVIGPKTLAAAKRADPREVIRLMFVERAMVFALHPKDELYGRGWFARLFDKTALALSEVP